MKENAKPLCIGEVEDFIGGYPARKLNPRNYGYVYNITDIFV